MVVVESKRGWRPRPGDPVAVTFDHLADKPAWHASLRGLRHWLEESKHTAADVEIVISNRFVRYALTPWSDDVRTRSELAALSRIHFEALFGESTDDWKIQADYGDYGMLGIGCALDNAFIVALQEICAAHKLRLISLQPHFMCAFNQWRSKIGRNALFAVVETGQCILATYKEGAWHSMRTVSLPGRAENQLSALIDREILLQGLGDNPEIYLHTFESIDIEQFKKDRSVIVLQDSSSAAVRTLRYAMASYRNTQ